MIDFLEARATRDNATYAKRSLTGRSTGRKLFGRGAVIFAPFLVLRRGDD